MRWRAITRSPSSSLARGERSFIARGPISFDGALRQHQRYRDALSELGVAVENLPALDGHPDAVFVEDAAVVLERSALLARSGAASRRGEMASVGDALARHRDVVPLEAPATLDGGDVLRAERTIYVGQTARTNAEGLAALSALAASEGLEVRAGRVDGCLHFKSACAYLGDGRFLVNPKWIDPAMFGASIIEVDPDEPFGANVLPVAGALLVPASAPKTHARLRSRGFHTLELDIGELEKCEAGLTCMSLLFTTDA